MRLEIVVLIVVLAAFVMAVLILVLLAPARERRSPHASPAVDVTAAPWSISRLAGDRFALRNETSARAFDVTLSGADDHLHVRVDTAIGTLAPGQQQPFVARCPIGVTDDRVVVTWRAADQQDGELMWACRLPTPPAG